MGTSQGKTQYTSFIEDELLEDAKIVALRRGCKVNDLLNLGLERELEAEAIIQVP